MSGNPKIDAYLGDVRAQLRSAIASEEEKVVLAITSRILVLAAEPGMNVDSAIEQLGPAKKVAIQYRDAHLIAKASQSLSPALLLQASLKNGVPGVLAFIVGLALYWAGGFALVFGTLSLIWSAVRYTPHTQLAIGTNVLELIEPIAVGGVIIVVTTLALRAMFRRSKRSKLSL
jgi:hypothetical protein